jgi:hypothetical protein
MFYRLYLKDLEGYEPGTFGAVFGGLVHTVDQGIRLADQYAAVGWEAQIRQEKKNGKVVYSTSPADHLFKVMEGNGS